MEDRAAATLSATVERYEHEIRSLKLYISQLQVQGTGSSTHVTGEPSAVTMITPSDTFKGEKNEQPSTSLMHSRGGSVTLENVKFDNIESANMQQMITSWNHQSPKFSSLNEEESLVDKLERMQTHYQGDRVNAVRNDNKIYDKKINLQLPKKALPFKKAKSSTPRELKPISTKVGRWTKEETEKFVRGLNFFGRYCVL